MSCAVLIRPGCIASLSARRKTRRPSTLADYARDLEQAYYYGFGVSAEVKTWPCDAEHAFKPESTQQPSHVVRWHERDGKTEPPARSNAHPASGHCRSGTEAMRGPPLLLRVTP